MASIAGVSQLSQEQASSASEITSMINTVSRIAFHVISSYEAIYRVGNLFYHAAHDYVILPLIAVGEFIYNKIQRVYLQVIEPTFFPNWRTNAFMNAFSTNSIETMRDLLIEGAVIEAGELVKVFYSALDMGNIAVPALILAYMVRENNTFIERTDNQDLREAAVILKKVAQTIVKFWKVSAEIRGEILVYHAQNNHPELTANSWRVLLYHGSTPPNEYLKQALNIFAERGQREYVKVLLEKFQFSVEDKQEAAQLAETNDHIEIVTLLNSHVA